MKDALIKALISQLLPVIITYLEGNKEVIIDYLIDQLEDYAIEEDKPYLGKLADVLRNVTGVEDDDD